MLTWKSKPSALLWAFSVFGHVKSPVFELVSLTSTVKTEGQAPLTVGGVAVTPQSKCCVNLNLMLMEGVFLGEIKAFVINIQLNFYKNVVTVFYLQNLLVGTFHYIWRFLNSFLQNTLPHCFSLLILNSYSCCTPSYCPTNR